MIVRSSHIITLPSGNLARSANGGRVEYFKTSTIINELLEMHTEFNEGVHGEHERACPLDQRACRLLTHKGLGGAHSSPLASTTRLVN